VTRADASPSARNTSATPPSTVTDSARPFDEAVHGSTRLRTASPISSAPTSLAMSAASTTVQSCRQLSVGQSARTPSSE